MHEPLSPNSQGLSSDAVRPPLPGPPGVSSRALTRSPRNPGQLPAPRWPPPRQRPGAALTRHGGRVPLGLQATGLGQERVVEPAGIARVRKKPGPGSPLGPARGSLQGCSPERVGLLHHLHLGGARVRGSCGERGVRRRGRVGGGGPRDGKGSEVRGREGKWGLGVAGAWAGCARSQDTNRTLRAPAAAPGAPTPPPSLPAPAGRAVT